MEEKLKNCVRFFLCLGILAPPFCENFGRWGGHGPPGPPCQAATDGWFKFDAYLLAEFKSAGRA